MIDTAAVLGLIGTTIRLSVPLTFAAIGGLFSERSGVLNIALEGMMLGGALGSAIAAFWSGSAWLGLLGGMLAGTLLAMLLAVLSISFRTNQTVAGIAINLLAIGATAFIARQIFPEGSQTARVNGFTPLSIPGLSQLPGIGEGLFRQDALTYLMILLIPLSWYVLFRTPWGLSIRAVGENPKASDVAGISVVQVRYLCVLLSGALAGMGGAYLVLSQVYVFTEEMSAGRGFIALAAVILGRWHPIGTLLACLFFGLCEALQLRLQFSYPEIPYQIFVTLPYLASLIALVGLVGQVRAPAASGQPYHRETR
jgi:simple sugar transport system permease protein